MAPTTIDQTSELPPAFQSVLQQIVDDVVERLGCMAALATTLEQDHLLPIRAYALNGPAERQERALSLVEAALTSSATIIDLNDGRYEGSLSSRAMRGKDGSVQKYLLSDQLQELFAPLIGKKESENLQALLGIQQLIAIPFFIDKTPVGSLFAAAERPFTQKDIDFLVAYGHQTALAIESHRRLMAMDALERVGLALQTEMTDETRVLQIIVDAVVQELGYAGAMVATLETGDELPVRAYRVDFADGAIRQLEQRAGRGLIGSKVNLNKESHKENLSVRAIKGSNGRPEKQLVSDQLYDLLRPFINRPLAKMAQRLIGINKVIAVPFYLDDEVVGNLFVATRRKTFTDHESELLIAFGRQAAVGLRNARLYQKAEQRREIAQKFGRMAFNATVSLHSLRNHIGSIRLYMETLKMLPNLPEAQQPEILGRIPLMLERLNTTAVLLDSLHDPWQENLIEPVDVVHALTRAFRTLYPLAAVTQETETMKLESGLIVHCSFAPDLPPVMASKEMLVEAFRILLKNAVDAINEKGKEQLLTLSCHRNARGQIEVVVQDNGTGIKPENLQKIFEMGWSTKAGLGMGFGLYWVRDYLEGLGGSLHVSSEWGKGSSFYIGLSPQKTSQ